LTWYLNCSLYSICPKFLICIFPCETIKFYSQFYCLKRKLKFFLFLSIRIYCKIFSLKSNVVKNFQFHFFFFSSLLTWVFLIYISIVILLPGFWANIPLIPPAPLLYGLLLPILPHYYPPPNDHVHWGFSLGRTQGFPFQ